jgi:hypothetical protein
MSTNGITWFKFSPAHWITGRIYRQSAEAQAAFIRLCCIYWTQGCHLTTERAEMEADGQYELLARLKMIADDGNGNLKIKFLDEQVDSLQERRGQLVAAGRASYAKRQERMNKSSTSAEQEPAQAEHPLSRVEKKRKEKSNKITHNGFLDFWDRYPRKENKPTAERAWAKLSKADQEAAIHNLTAWIQNRATQDPKFLPHPGSWLNGRRWEDQTTNETKHDGTDTEQHYY